MPHTSQQRLGERLYKASREGDVRRVTQLLEEGAPINWRKSSGYTAGWTALHVACNNNRIEIVKLLLKHKPLVNQQTNSGDTPLHWACQMGFLECIKLLLASGQCNLG